MVFITLIIVEYLGCGGGVYGVFDAIVTTMLQEYQQYHFNIATIMPALAMFFSRKKRSNYFASKNVEGKIICTVVI